MGASAFGLQPAEATPGATNAAASTSPPAAINSNPNLDPGSDEEAAAAAALAARTQGRAIEDLTQRTESTQVFANPDGTWTAETASGPVRARDDRTGDWEPIDTRLIPAAGGFAPKNALGDLVLSDGGSSSFATMRVDGGQAAWQWPTGLPEPIIEGDRATYVDVIPDGDLVVTATATGFRHDILLHKRPEEAVVVEIPIKTTGVSVVEDSGTVDIVGASGDELISSTAPIMYETKVNAEEMQQESVPVEMDVTRGSSTRSMISLAPSLDYLQDPSTQYPVTIDPTYSDSSYVANDTFVGSGDPYSYYPWNESLLVGSENGGSNIYRSFLQFTDTPWIGASVTDAKLLLRNHRALTCSGSTVRVNRVTAAFDNGNMRWRDQAPVTTDGQASATAAYGRSGCSTPTDVTWNVTTIVAAWASRTASNYGLRVSA